MRKVAIIGSASISLHGAPFMDETWEIWALGRERRRVTRYYEMHQDKDLAPDVRAFYRTLKNTPAFFLPGNEYPDEQFPTAQQYPLNQVIDDLGRDWFCSSCAYMVALAIHEQVDEIGLWGVDMLAGSEYAQQRPNLTWLLGIAQGRGIKVEHTGILLESNYRYGRDPQPDPGPCTPEYLARRELTYKARLNDLKEQASKIEKDWLLVEGARQETVLLINHMENYKRGGMLPGGK